MRFNLPTAGILLANFLTTTALFAAPPGVEPVVGLRDKAPSFHALTNARIVVSADKTIEQGTLVIRDGVIVDVNSVGNPPDGAKVHDLAGKTIYPGLIDAYATTSVTKPNGPNKHFSSLITPQGNVVDSLQVDDKIQAKLRKQGVTARLTAPESGILRGTSALVATLDAGSAEAILHPSVAQHVWLGLPSGRGRSEYPNSPMGAVALARQTMLDADWYGRLGSTERHASLPFGPKRNDALECLSQQLHARKLFILDARNELNFGRAVDFSNEFALNTAMRGSGREYRILESVRQAGRPVILPINFPKAPNVDSPEAAMDASLEDLMHWELAPANPGRLAAAGVTIALSSYGLSKVEDFLPRIQTAVKHGLSAGDALRALTINPAKLFGVEDRLGTLEAGKRADLVITDGDLFLDKTKIVETWIAGKAFRMGTEKSIDVRGTWLVNIEKSPVGRKRFELAVGGTAFKPTAGLKLDENKKPKSIKLDEFRLDDRQMLFRLPSTAFGSEMAAQVSMTILADTTSLDNSEKWNAVGTARLSDGRHLTIRATRTDAEPVKIEVPPSKSESEAKKANETKDATKESERTTLAEIRSPFLGFGRTSPPPQPERLLIRNATLWTCSDTGTIATGSLLIENGSIAAVAEGELDVAENMTVIDAQGKHVTPGIIDCHSHIATDGGVNESSQAITCEVRVGDFVDSNDIQIYRQLAGGVTCVNILHGSSNPIGGQNQVIKLRWGEPYRKLKMHEAPPGVKFALGENVKQSYLESSTRYPQSRMGVEQIIRDAFIAAREYDAEWHRWKTQHDIPLPRRDLELEALSEILRGERLVHCHSYRQDEILTLLRLCEEFGLQVATLQHILEGYKVADVMAKHGAMASSFADWWAYKFEVYDAIPYNGSLMHRAGVNVSFNSDDPELARHLNHEAAKAVKYGNIEPDEALKFVTLNPAKQLRIDEWVGSLEPGKQADFAIWSGPPLSPMSRCEQTWIDGKCYFDIESDRKLREENRRLKAKLIQKILKLKKSGSVETADDSKSPDDDENWIRYDEFCRAQVSGGGS